MTGRTGRDAAIGLGAGILGALANEHLSARPRISQAFRDGYAQREIELRPEIQRLEREISILRGEVTRLSVALQVEQSKIRLLIGRVVSALRSKLLPPELKSELRNALPPGSG
jgi:hypothetical protein